MKLSPHYIRRRIGSSPYGIQMLTISALNKKRVNCVNTLAIGRGFNIYKTSMMNNNTNKEKYDDRSKMMYDYHPSTSLKPCIWAWTFGLYRRVAGPDDRPCGSRWKVFSSSNNNNNNRQTSPFYKSNDNSKKLVWHKVTRPCNRPSTWHNKSRLVSGMNNRMTATNEQNTPTKMTTATIKPL
eukprot:scaffold1374_cov175-Amphora_coffeaeformis.AAC.4